MTRTLALDVPPAQMNDLIRRAALAPSVRNTQPWQFHAERSEIRILPDYSRRLQSADPDGRALFASLGCALEHLLIAARFHGYEPVTECFPEEEPVPCLRVRLRPALLVPDAPLYPFIGKQSAIPHAFERRPIPAPHLSKLALASEQSAVVVHLVATDAEREPLLELAKDNVRAQFESRGFVAEFVRWHRLDGNVGGACSEGLGDSLTWLPRVMPERVAVLVARLLATGRRQASACERLLRDAPALAVFAPEQEDRHSWVAVGRSFARVALTATSLKIGYALVSIPCAAPDVRARLEERMELETAEPLLLMRLGHLPKEAPRKSGAMRAR